MGRMGATPPPIAKVAGSVTDYYRQGPYRDFAQEHRSGGTFGVRMIQVEQGTIETVDPAATDVSFACNVGNVAPFETNFGDGWKRHTPSGRMIDIQPAATECSLRLPPMTLRIVHVEETCLRSLLAAHRLSANTLDGVTERCRHVPRAIAALDSI